MSEPKLILLEELKASRPGMTAVDVYENEPTDAFDNVVAFAEGRPENLIAC